MGKTKTYTHRVEVKTTTGSFQCTYEPKYSGKAGLNGLLDFVTMTNKSLDIGGMSHNDNDLRPQHIVSAKLVKQSKGNVIAEYKKDAPRFEVLNA